MAKLARFVQKVFGSSAGASQIAKFGSLAAGSPAFTTDPAVIQSLGNYLTGWFGAVVGANSPAIEDMNALCYLFAYQLTYLMQTGVAEWDAAQIYFKGSLVNDGGGLVYSSLTDNNVNNALTDATNWAAGNGRAYNKIVPSPSYPTLSSVVFTAGDSILVLKDVTETAQILVNVSDVRVDFAPGKFLISSLTSGSLLKVTGARFRSTNLNIQATGAMGAGQCLLELAGNDAIVSALFLSINNGAIAITDAIKMSGDRNDITSGSIVAAAGTYTDPYSSTGTANDSRIRG